MPDGTQKGEIVMELNVRKDYISVAENTAQVSAEQAVDCDITLPEYLPDMVRVLRCTALPGIKAHHITGDRITADCECVVRVLYVCGENKIHTVEQALHFSKQLELKDSAEDTAVIMGAKADYLNHRVLGQRKLELHGAVTVFASLYCKKRRELVCSAEGDGVAVQSEGCAVCDLTSLTAKDFSVFETCEISPLPEAVTAVIDCCASPVIDEIKIISDKLFLKGSLYVKTAYLYGDRQETGCFENMIAFSQIIEAPEITEDCRPDAKLTITCLNVTPKYDSAGGKNLLDISADLSLLVMGYTVREIGFVKDAYSVKYECKPEKAIIGMPVLAQEIQDSLLCRGTVQLTELSQIVSFMCSAGSPVFSSYDAGKINGAVTADIIYLDTKGEPCFAKREIPFEYACREKPPEGSQCRPDCRVTGYSYTLSGAGEVDVRAEITVRGFVFCTEEKAVTTSLGLDKTKVKKSSGAALTVYFADAGETLWSIAESYNTTVEAIIRENHIPDAPINRPCKLLIPKI